MAIRISKRAETRIAVSKATVTALKSYLQLGEPYDVLIRRLLISGVPKTLDGLTDAEREWVLVQETGWQYPDQKSYY
jgi:hypothetical protein